MHRSIGKQGKGASGTPAPLWSHFLPPPTVKDSDVTGAKHDWHGMIAVPPALTKPNAAQKLREDDDPANAGIRNEPEIQRHEDVAPKPKKKRGEFDFDRGLSTDDEDAARNRRLQDRMRSNARRAALGPGDGIEL